MITGLFVLSFFVWSAKLANIDATLPQIIWILDDIADKLGLQISLILHLPGNGRLKAQGDHWNFMENPLKIGHSCSAGSRPYWQANIQNIKITDQLQYMSY